MRKGFHENAGMLAALLAAVLAPPHAVAADAGDQAAPPCAVRNVAAYAAAASDKCRVRPAAVGAGRKQSRPIVKNESLFAGDRIDCLDQAKVTITFCASRDDKVVGGTDSTSYIIPNVSGKTRDEGGAGDAALRRAQLESVGKQQRLVADLAEMTGHAKSLSHDSSHASQGASASASGAASASASAAAPASVALGQTPEQVKGLLGTPVKIIDVGARKIYFYKDLKIVFVAGKVADVQ